MFIKSPVFWIIGILAVIGLIAVLGFYQGIAIALAVLSILISTFFASRSLKLTNESLKLTRNKVRPFVFVQSGDRKVSISPKIITLAFEIENVGVLPGELISIETQFFAENELITHDNKSEYLHPFSEIPSQPILFPNSTFTIVNTIDITVQSGQIMWDIIHAGKAKARYRIKYKDKLSEYLTIQTEHISEVNRTDLIRLPISPQYWT